jgi:ankyrin repeat protein
MDLVILGFDDLVSIIESKFGGEEKMRDNGLSDQADQIYTVIPQVQAKIQELKKNVESKDLNSLKANLDKKSLAFYRDKQGKSPLHTAVEKGYFEIAIYLLESCPLLSKINDCVIKNLFFQSTFNFTYINIYLFFKQSEQQPLDYLKHTDASALDEHDAVLYEKLNQLLS